MKQQDAIALLKADHKKVKELFAQVEDTSERAKAQLQRLGDEICAELTVHTQIEEKIFYPAVQERTKRGHKEEKDLVLESYEEHAAAKKVIEDIQATDSGDESYKPKVKTLSELIDHHVKEEESRAVPRCARAVRRRRAGRTRRASHRAEGAAAGRDRQNLTATVSGDLFDDVLGCVRDKHDLAADVTAFEQAMRFGTVVERVHRHDRYVIGCSSISAFKRANAAGFGTPSNAVAAIPPGGCTPFGYAIRPPSRTAATQRSSAGPPLSASSASTPAGAMRRTTLSTSS